MKGGCIVAVVASGYIGSVGGMSVEHLRARFVPMTEIHGTL